MADRARVEVRPVPGGWEARLANGSKFVSHTKDTAVRNAAVVELHQVADVVDRRPGEWFDRALLARAFRALAYAVEQDGLADAPGAAEMFEVVDVEALPAAPEGGKVEG